MIRVLIADDDHLMRAGLAELLSSDREIEVIGQASTGREAIARARSLAPDIVLMDVRMPDLDGIVATRELSRVAPGVRVLMLTTFEQDDYIFGALRAGASGFLLKRTRPEDLIAAVHTIASGESLLSPSVTRRVIDAFPDDKLFSFSVGGMRSFGVLAMEMVAMAVPMRVSVRSPVLLAGTLPPRAAAACHRFAQMHVWNRGTTRKVCSSKPANGMVPAGGIEPTA